MNKKRRYYDLLILFVKRIKPYVNCKTHLKIIILNLLKTLGTYVTNQNVFYLLRPTYYHYISI